MNFTHITYLQFPFVEPDSASLYSFARQLKEREREKTLGAMIAQNQFLALFQKEGGKVPRKGERKRNLTSRWG